MIRRQRFQYWATELGNECHLRDKIDLGSKWPEASSQLFYKWGCLAGYIYKALETTTMVPPSSSPIMILVIILALVAAAMAGNLYDENVLYGGQRLSSYTGGQELRWEDYVLYLNTDCNLNIVKISSVSWSTNTQRNGVLCFLHMQLDGNLVLYDVRNNVLWQSNTAGRRGENVLLLRPDGNAAIYGSPIWSTRVSWHPASPHASALERPKIPLSTKLGGPSTYARFVGNVLYEGERLLAGQELSAKSYRLIMENDCTLVLYNGYDLLWASDNRKNGPNCYLELNKNGNLIIYNGQGISVWHSGTERGDGDYALIVQDTGTLVLYSKVLWSKPNAVSSGLITTTSNSSYMAHQGKKMKIAMVAAGNQE